MPLNMHKYSTVFSYTVLTVACLVGICWVFPLSLFATSGLAIKCLASFLGALKSVVTANQCDSFWPYLKIVISIDINFYGI